MQVSYLVSAFRRSQLTTLPGIPERKCSRSEGIVESRTLNSDLLVVLSLVRDSEKASGKVECRLDHSVLRFSPEYRELAARGEILEKVSIVRSER